MRKLVPFQWTGTTTGAISRIKKKNREEAIQLFNVATQRLKNINQWNVISSANTIYSLFDKKGMHLLNKEPEVGDLIRISIPAPTNKTGDGYDWVKIEKIVQQKDRVDDSEIFGFRVRPVSSPTNKEADTAHFYQHNATSSFFIMRSGNIVQAVEKGMNEKPNLKVKNTWNKLRNLMVSLTAILGGGHSNWKPLTNGLLGITSNANDVNGTYYL